MIRLDPADVAAARAGSRAALERVLAQAEGPVFNLAMRMLAHRADAEDATQEILIRIVTHLGTLRQEEAAGAWALSVACRHLVRRRRRGRIEAMRLSFEGFAADLAEGQAPLAEAGLTGAEAALALREVKTACTLAMLTCLSRPLRIAYLLGDVFDLTDAEAAPVLGITPAAYRQRLTRAREKVVAFTRAACGLVSPAGACRCERRVKPAMACGRVVRGAAGLGAGAMAPDEVARRVQRLGEGRRAAALMRSNPEFGSRVRDLVVQALAR